MEVPNIQIQENPSSGRHADTCGWTKRRNETKVIDTFRNYVNSNFNYATSRVGTPHPITISPQH